MCSDGGDGWRGNESVSLFSSVNWRLIVNPIRQAMVDSAEDDITEDIVAEEYLEIRNLVDGLPSVQVPDEPAKPMGWGAIAFKDVDFDALVEMCRLHQTRQAAEGVWMKLSWDNGDEEKKKQTTLKQQIIKRFHKTLKESQDEKAIGTGYKWSARWQAPAWARDGESKGTVADPFVSSNATNAALASAAVVKQVHIFSDNSKHPWTFSPMWSSNLPGAKQFSQRPKFLSSTKWWMRELPPLGH